MWFLDRFKEALFNTGDPAMRGGNQSSNTAADAMPRISDPYTTGKFYSGVVVRAGAGTYDVCVQTVGTTAVTCMLGQSMGCYYFGVTDCCIPAEGSRVVVYLPHAKARYGVVLCVLPSADLGSVVAEGGDSPQVLVDSLDIEPGASAVTEAAYLRPWADQDNMDNLTAHMGRPHDLFPGNKAWLNEHGVGLAILNLMVSLKATDRAKIECGVLDDFVRVFSGYYRHHSAQGDEAIYNDEGRLTHELSGTSYQEERDGQKKLGTKNFIDTGTKEVFKESLEARIKLLKEKQCAKKRFQLYTGYLGDMVNFFVANPDPNVDTETTSNDSKDQGLMHMHLDSSGRVQMRSAAGFSFERWDRIPVPKKKYEPWEPEGDKDLEDPKEKKPFEFNKDHPYGRSLQMRDAMAWRNKAAYQRMHDQSTGAGKKDYFIPEEMEMEVPKDMYDEPGKGEEKFKESDGRRAYFNIEDDGSIVMRDAWGSEILMRGGNIIFNCAGNIEVRSAKSIIQMAGHDIITKARKSVDITARDKDVRIKANVNLHLLSEGREGDDAAGGGGILIESRAKNDTGTYGFDGNKGEQVLSTGIVLKAVDSRVFMQGKVVHSSCSQRIIIEGKDPDGGPAVGDVWVACKTLFTNSTNSTLITAGQVSGIAINNSAGMLYGPTAAVVGGASLALLKGSKAWIPLMEADISADPYSDLADITQTIYNLYQAEDTWLTPYLPPEREVLKFTYRSAQEYGTNRGSEVYQGNKFYVYRPMWAQMLDAGHKYINETIDTWSEYAIEQTFVWPGELAYNGSEAYQKMSAETNLSDAAKELPMPRKDVVNESGTFSPGSFHEYEVVET